MKNDRQFKTGEHRLRLVDRLPSREENEKEIEKIRLKRSVFWPTAFVVLLWLVKIVEILLVGLFGPQARFVRFGILPLHPEGLRGILTGPLIHGDFMHLFSNSVPLIVLGAGILYLYRPFALRVIILVYLLGGLGVWLFARPVYHIGASGLIYGFIAFIFWSGVFRREPRAIALALIVTFLYGGLVWGVLPIREGVSWEGHLSGAVVGAVLAYLYRKKDLPKDQDEPDDWDEEEDEDFEYWKR